MMCVIIMVNNSIIGGFIMFKLKKINTHAFTLVELLATIVILGIIMLIAVPAFNNYTSSA